MPAALAATDTIRIGKSPVEQPRLGFGGSWFVPYTEPSDEDRNLLAAMEAAYDAGIRHFDTAATYGKGHSEELYARFIAPRRDEIFLASKFDPAESTAAAIYAEVNASLHRLNTDRIDLYYIHWPRTGRDMRPVMEGLERARAEGKIGAVGVSNFGVAEMEQVSEVGTIDAHQLGYNLIWRYAEEDVIPWCIAHDVKLVTYSTMAHGILTGKFARDPGLREGDQRHRILPFRADIWPYVHAGVERMKAIAEELNRPLAHLAIRWNLAQPGIASVIIGGRNAAQVNDVAGALDGDIPRSALEELTAISDEIVRHVPRADNLFGRVG